MESNLNKINWNFDNSYTDLPSILMESTFPTPVKNPNLEILNFDLANQLDLNLHNQDKKKLSLLFSGNILPSGSNCIAQAYAGHQFGNFTNLGDGRAILLGEHINKKNIRFDIQFKGSGKTPYSRNGDGRAGIGPMLREYVISEAMYGLNIPTTRSLAVVSTGEEIFREKIYKGAILTRVASSHLRVGTFQYLAMHNDINSLRKLVNYTLNRHYPKIDKKENQSLELLKSLMERQISLIVNWMRVGFIHGVMNTDNMSICGETIDYGPCAFMNHYDPSQVYSSIDQHGRYSFSNQKLICHWNLSRFAETLIPLLSDSKDKAIEIGTEIINTFDKRFKTEWLNMMKKKLGFIGFFQDDEKFINKLLSWMHKNNADYTNTFLFLMDNKNLSNEIHSNESFKQIHREWLERIKKNNCPKIIWGNIMKENNPIFIPRNHIVEEAIENASENNDFNKINELASLVKNPYISNNTINDNYIKPPSLNQSKNYQTYCGT